MIKEIIKIDSRDFNIDQTFDCGQCFRWEREADGSRTGVLGSAIVNMRFDPDQEELSLEAEDQGENFSQRIRDFLDLDTDYGEIKKELSERDPVIAQAAEAGSGIRILRQDYWETLVSFIISQNNNIPRIRGCIEKLCALLGEPAGTYGGPGGEHPGRMYYTIPTPERLAAAEPSDLAPARLGYRAPYLIAAGRQFLEDPDRTLTDFTGVGPKVANCIALFGKHELDAFPIDVWVKRVMSRLYGFSEEDVRGMASFARKKFTPWGGVAQQYLFYYIRELENVKL